jgi:hypothetical protein
MWLVVDVRRSWISMVGCEAAQTACELGATFLQVFLIVAN